MGRLIDADATLDFIKANLQIRPEFIIEHAPTVEAIPKDEYEARLKADLVAILEDLDLQIDELTNYNLANNLEVTKVQRLIRDRINSLKENTDVL